MEFQRQRLVMDISKCIYLFLATTGTTFIRFLELENNLLKGKDMLLSHLQILNSLTVEAAINVLSSAYFANFYYRAKASSISEIERWIIALNEKGLSDSWFQHYKRERPFVILHRIYFDIKLETMAKRKYSRLEFQGFLPTKESDQSRILPIVNDIEDYLTKLTLVDSIEYIAELTGAWILSCPQALVRQYDQVENVGKWMGKDPINWQVPETYGRIWLSGASRGNAPDLSDQRLAFTLDYLFIGYVGESMETYLPT